jgi:hypothetical protein
MVSVRLVAKVVLGSVSVIGHTKVDCKDHNEEQPFIIHVILAFRTYIRYVSKCGNIDSTIDTKKHEPIYSLAFWLPDTNK